MESGEEKKTREKDGKITEETAAGGWAVPAVGRRRGPEDFPGQNLVKTPFIQTVAELLSCSSTRSLPPYLVLPQRLLTASSYQSYLWIVFFFSLAP